MKRYKVQQRDITYTNFISNYQAKCIIECRKSSRSLAQELNRVKSSNVYSIGFDIDDDSYTGNLLMQFKDSNGMAGDIYMYFDVPISVYRKLQSAPSKGHYFWKYIRNRYKYRKLTGDRRGKLPNAIN